MPHVRSQYGCWTCRVRKKKCDEHQPMCMSCSSRGITCHGYGPKPDWLDGGEREEAILADLRSEVKAWLRQRKDAAKQQLAQQRELAEQQQTITCLPCNPKATPNNAESFSSSLGPLTQGFTIPPCALDPLLSPLPSQVSQHPYTVSSPKHSNEPVQNTLSFAPLSRAPHEDVRSAETALLMGYLDKVFPRQFGCYVPPSTDWGRGWLLALFTRTKPLHHAAVALSAFYQHSSMLEAGRLACMEPCWTIVVKHHGLALEQLRLHLQDLRSSGVKGKIEARKGIDILACTIQMISFELLRGGTDSWQIHLQAASTIIPPLIASSKMNLKPSISPESLPADLSWSHSTSSTMKSSLDPTSHLPGDSRDNESRRLPPPLDHLAHDFLVGTFIWFDIMAAASTRSKPLLPGNSSYLYLSCCSDVIMLDGLMGCENWVMMLISSISLLDEQKHELGLSKCQDTGQLCEYAMAELFQRGREIATALNVGLRANEEALQRHQEQSVASESIAEVVSKRNALQMTAIFGHSALTYLHVVLLGADPALPQISSSVSLCMLLLRNLSDPNKLKGLLWPLCVTGCMAQYYQQGFFENLMEKLISDATCPKNIRNTYDIMKECWRLRKDGSCNVDWTKAMQTAHLPVLLV